ncbi:tetratricopeptide repeat protein 28-like [Oculina patagonica]
MMILSIVPHFLVNTGRYHAAIEFFKEWLTLNKFLEDINLPSPVEFTVYTYHALATTYFFIGNYSETKANAKRALKISKSIVDKKGERRSYYLIFCAFEALCRYDKAIKYLDKALQVSKETGDVKYEGAVYCYLGQINYDLGQYEKAKECQLMTIKIAKEIGNKEMETMALFYLSKVLTYLDKLEESQQIRDEALKLSDETGDGSARAAMLYREAIASGGIGKKENKSLELLQKTLQICKETNDCESEGICCAAIGTHFGILEQYDEAIKYFERALEISNSIGDRQVKENACIWLSDIYLALGQKDKATEYKEQVMEIIREVGARKVPMSFTLTRLAASWSSGGDIQKACDVSAESVKCFESELEHLTDEYKLSVGEMFCGYFSCYKWHSYLLIELGRNLVALLAAERGRARVLRELLSKNYAIEEKFEPLNENSLSNLIHSLTKEQTLVFIAITLDKTFFWVLTNVDSKTEMFNPKESSADDMFDLLEATLQITFGSLTTGRDIDCEDRSLSAFYYSESTSNEEEGRGREGKRLIELDDEENGDNARNTPHKLYDMLIAPFADRIEGREVVIVPEGSMFMIPFASLQDANGKFLSEKCRIRIAPSLATLKLILDSPADFHSQTGALIVGDPDVSRVRELGQLPAARQEAKEIAELLNVSPLLGEQATKEEVLRRINNVCLIHIAAHGDAKRGEIACAPNPSSPRVPSKEDFVLTMEDISKVGIRAKLVVLSCCHSGRGKIMQAEGVVGIARAFIASGARSVLVSLWLLNDDSTKEFMIRFYGHLVRDKLSASEALHQSMKWMRDSKKYSVSDWAPFVLIGDDVTVDLLGSL